MSYAEDVKSLRRDKLDDSAMQFSRRRSTTSEPAFEIAA